MPRQWIRKVSLLVGADSGEGLDLGEFRITFRVAQWDVSTPNTMVARVYNLKRETVNRIRGEFNRVVLRAGYEGGFGTIFSGTIRHTRAVWESATERVIEIYAADGDLAYNWSVVNTTLAAGATSQDVVGAATSAFAQNGVVVGASPDLRLQVYPRGVAVYGMARDVLTDELSGLSMGWSIQNETCQIVERDGYIPGEAIVINAQTGMVGAPELTEDGIIVNCLLNPNLRVAGRVKLNNESIQGFRYDLRYTALNMPQTLSTAADGIYKVLAIDHAGDTRGQEYYSRIICVAPQDGVTIPQALRGRT